MTEMMRAAIVPPDAQRAIAPWTNFDRSDVSFARFGWETPGAMGFEPAPAGKSGRLALPGDATVVAPPLMTKDGTVTVFTYTPSHLTMLRVPMPAKGGSAPVANVQWTGAFAGAPFARRRTAALGPQPRRNLACMITVSPTATGAAVTLFEDNGNGQGRVAEAKSARNPAQFRTRALWSMVASYMPPFYSRRTICCGACFWLKWFGMAPTDLPKSLAASQSCYRKPAERRWWRSP